MKSVPFIVVFLLGVVVGGGGVFLTRPADDAGTAPAPSAPASLPGVLVSVRNDTGGPLKNVEVHYTGGSFYTDTLSPAERFSKRISPTGESALEVAFSDQSGSEVCVEVDSGLRPDGAGSLLVSIQPEGKLEIKDERKAQQ